MIGQVYASGTPAVVPNVGKAAEFIDRTGAFGGEEGGTMMAFVVVPLKTDKAVVGVLAAVALGMAMLPEEFPMALAVFLALGAWRLARAAAACAGHAAK